MTAAYLRRLRFESRAQAVAVVNALGEAMGSKGKSGEIVSADEFLQVAGIGAF